MAVAPRAATRPDYSSAAARRTRRFRAAAARRTRCRPHQTRAGRVPGFALRQRQAAARRAIKNPVSGVAIFVVCGDNSLSKSHHLGVSGLGRRA